MWLIQRKRIRDLKKAYFIEFESQIIIDEWDSNHKYESCLHKVNRFKYKPKFKKPRFESCPMLIPYKILIQKMLYWLQRMVQIFSDLVNVLLFLYQIIILIEKAHSLDSSGKLLSRFLHQLVLVECLTFLPAITH